MRTEFTLWKASNGFILIPEETGNSLTAEKAANATIFKDLSEFSKFKPKRVRKPRTKPTQPKESNQ